MKKILVPVLLLTLLFITLGCEQSDYEIKTLIVKNESEVDLHSLTIKLSDGYIDQRITLTETYPIIYLGESKEYAIPYIKTGQVSPQIQVTVSDNSTVRSMSRAIDSVTKRITFTFDTSMNEDIILTFDEGEEVGTYQFSGEGSGFEEIINYL